MRSTCSAVCTGLPLVHSTSSLFVLIPCFTAVTRTLIRAWRSRCACLDSLACSRALCDCLLLRPPTQLSTQSVTQRGDKFHLWTGCSGNHNQAFRGWEWEITAPQQTCTSLTRVAILVFRIWILLLQNWVIFTSLIFRFSFGEICHSPAYLSSSRGWLH